MVTLDIIDRQFHLTGYYSREECHIDLLKLCSFARVVMINAEVIGLNVEKQEVYCSDGRPPIKYDILSINVGITPSPLPSPLFSNRLVLGSPTPTIPKITMNSITPVKPIDGFCIRWDNILKRVKNIAHCGDATNYVRMSSIDLLSMKDLQVIMIMLFKGNCCGRRWCWRC